MLSFIDYLNLIQFVVMLVGIILSVKIWWKIRGAKRAAVELEKEKGAVVIVLKVKDTMIVESVEKCFKDKKIEYIDAKEELGTYTLTTQHDYEKLSKAVYGKIAQHQGQHIHLVLSGPLGLSCLIGQMIGINYFSVEVYQHNPRTDEYESLPIVTREWHEQILIL